MSPGMHVLAEFWMAMAAHLWQTTLVLAALFVLGWAMRDAPARLTNALWWIGLAKLFLPLPVLGPVGSRTLQPLTDAVVVWEGEAGALSSWLSRATLLLDPAAAAVRARPENPALVQALSVGLSVLWVAGMVLVAARWIRRRSRPSVGVGPVLGDDPDLEDRLEAARAGTGIPREAVELSPGSAVPGVRGLVRPRIVIPERVVRDLSRADLRAILLHENEHRRRHDPLRSLAVGCALTIFFFYPPLWLLVGRLRASGEIACDEAAVRAGIPPAAYASALARTVGLGLLPAAAPAAIHRERPSLLRRRFERLDEVERFVAMRKHRVALALAVAWVGLLSFVPLTSVGGVGPGGRATPPEILPAFYVAPEYPEGARKDGIGGEVVLDVRVGEDGRVTDLRVVEGIADHPEFDESTASAVRQWRFRPANENGRPVAMWVKIPVHFRLD